MRYLYKRGRGARRRVMHLTPFHPRTGEPTMTALCRIRLPFDTAFDTTCNVPFGQPICKRCTRISREVSR